MLLYVLVMKELNLGSKILGFFLEFEDLLGSNIDLAIHYDFHFLTFL